MGWQKYTLCFRLLSPMHIGWRKVGNLMQTRGYVPGKVLWAALTARLTRDSGNGANASCYIQTGEAVRKAFKFAYLYPALPEDPAKEVKSNDDLVPCYPWIDRLFDYRFLDSYAGTTLNYDLQTAAEGELREVEFIRPVARALFGEETPRPVYLAGCLYLRDEVDESLSGWREALCRLQLGGERGYGWGRVSLEYLANQGVPEEPIQKVEKGKYALAHVKAGGTKMAIHGHVEPLTG